MQVWGKAQVGTRDSGGANAGHLWEGINWGKHEVLSPPGQTLLKYDLHLPPRLLAGFKRVLLEPQGGFVYLLSMGKGITVLCSGVSRPLACSLRVMVSQMEGPR